MKRRAFAPDTSIVVRALAAALFVLLVFTAGTAVAARDVGKPVAETYICSATDRKFIEIARVNLPAFATWRADYVAGGVDHASFAAVAQEARVLVERSGPHDRSLSQARLLASAMLAEYHRTATEREAGGLGAKSLLHAQQLEVTLRGHLAEAAPGLAAVGCEISALFAV